MELKLCQEMSCEICDQIRTCQYMLKSQKNTAIESDSFENRQF